MTPGCLLTSFRILAALSFIPLMGLLLGCKSNFFGNRVAEPAMIPLAGVPVPGVDVRGNQPLPVPDAGRPALRPLLTWKRLNMRSEKVTLCGVLRVLTGLQFLPCRG